MNVSLLRRLGEKLSASGLIFHTNDHQGHVVTLGTVLGGGQDLLHDAFNDLRRCGHGKFAATFRAAPVPTIRVRGFPLP
jgi:hypothetical protein